MFIEESRVPTHLRDYFVKANNSHCTVKPTDLMRYLCRLVTPPGGLVLDPFTGSGSTGKAAKLEGFRFIGFEMSPEYAEIARRRIG
jgi:DNA modification methylase